MFAPHSYLKSGYTPINFAILEGTGTLIDRLSACPLAADRFAEVWCLGWPCAGLRSLITTAGISIADPRIAKSVKQMDAVEQQKGPTTDLSLQEFRDILRPNLRMMCAPDNQN